MYVKTRGTQAGPSKPDSEIPSFPQEAVLDLCLRDCVHINQVKRVHLALGRTAGSMTRRQWQVYDKSEEIEIISNLPKILIKMTAHGLGTYALNWYHLFHCFITAYLSLSSTMKCIS